SGPGGHQRGRLPSAAHDCKGATQMDTATRGSSHHGATSEERTHTALETLGGTVDGPGQRADPDGELRAHPVPVQERIRRLPEALLLTAGYYASRAPALAELLRRRR